MSHLPIFFILSFLSAALIIPLFKKEGRVYTFSLFVLGIQAIVSVYALAAVHRSGTHSYHLGGWIPPIGIELVLDPLSAFMLFLMSIVTFLVIFHGKQIVDADCKERKRWFFSCLFLYLAGLNGIVLTGDLFNLYVFLELSSLAGYALVAHGTQQAPFSAFRYLLIGTIGASFYLLGVGFVLFTLGTLNIADVSQSLVHVGLTDPIVIALALMMVGIAVKMALFPLHSWLPDTYTHASSIVTTLVAPIGTKVAAYMLIRIFFTMANTGSMSGGAIQLLDLIALLGAIGIIWGSVMAIAQRDLKRMLAWSSISQIGYIALGIGLASPLAMIAALLHLLGHACMKACLFMSTSAFAFLHQTTKISELRRTFSSTMPFTSVALAVCAISMIGLPPTIGFFTKWYLVLAMLEQGQILYIAVILLSSLLGAVYFFRVLEKLYFGITDNIEGVAKVKSESFRMALPVMLLAIAVVLLGIYNAKIVEFVFTPILDDVFSYEAFTHETVMEGEVE